METTSLIYQKLEAFIKKFYTNELIKGLIIFIGLGLLYFLFTLFVEYFLWLKPTGRTFLFFLFVVVECFLLFRFILFPLFKLFKLQKGIDYHYASTIIGNHFTNVNDQLINFLQLSNDNFDNNASELALASIEQKAKTLQPIPFSNAVNFNASKKLLPVAIIPLLLFIFFYFSGNSTVITESLDRVLHFKTQFLPPAPFQFVVLNKTLQSEKGNDFVLQVKTVGNITPENAVIFINKESYFMERTRLGVFEYRFNKLDNDVVFYIKANEVVSAEYKVSVAAVPTITNFEMVLNFPSYLNRKPEIVKGTGNAIIPEGTRVTWKVATVATESITFSESKNENSFKALNDNFQFSRTIVNNLDYQIITSNRNVNEFEKLNYQIAVVKDQHPKIEANNAPDSLKIDKSVVVGQVSDDYGLSKLMVVYYPKNKPEGARRATIGIKREVFDQFMFAFPGSLPVEAGTAYEYYFEVFDNDVFHNFKSTRSSLFSSRIATADEKEDLMLQEQNETISSMKKSLKNQSKQISDLDKLQKSAKEKDNFEFKDQQKVSDFIKRQKQQDEMMKQFTERMKDNLDQFKVEKNDVFKEELQKRLENTQKDLDKNQKLLDELKELNDKINQEQMVEKMDKFKQNSKNQVKNLEQLVELTKKYYVEKKAEQLASKLDQLSKKQDALSEKGNENTLDKQKDINDQFDKIQEDLKELQKENKELKSPMEIPTDLEKEKSIDEDLKKASDELQKDNKSAAKPKQKSASKKMKEMSAQMEQSLSAGEQEQMEEDVAMLRQILDNLLAFSFSQEDLMGQFRNSKKGAPAFNKNLKLQQDLRLQFQHVDDSLFALSMRQPKISENITKEVGNVHYNINKSLESLVESLIPKGVSHQQYTILSSNKLADMLSDVLNSMQMSLSGSSGGKPKPGNNPGMQLPDIIKKQEGLGEKMKQNMKDGDKPGEKSGEKPGIKPGEGQKGNEGKSGEKGKFNFGENDGQDGEGNAGEIMQIYKEQRQLREALERELNNKGFGGNGHRAVDQMKDIEKQLLNKGFKNEVLQRILNVKQELLKLDKAIQEQGEEERRQGETTKQQFNNQSKALPDNVKNYLNSIEILNRQSLPLRSNFNRKVLEYFNKND